MNKMYVPQFSVGPILMALISTTLKAMRGGKGLM
jgi:hypothetical protein